MAFQSLSRRTLAKVATRQAVSIRSPTYYALRSMTTSSDGKVDPEVKAKGLIEMLPGDSVIAKTGYIAATTGLTAFLISKEIYVFNEETIVLGAFAGLIALLYSKVSQPMDDWVSGYGKTLENILTTARNEHKTSVQDKIESLSQLKDVVATTKNMFDLSREMVNMLSEINDLNQKIAIRQEVKSVLDSWVRHEESVRQNEQREISQHVIESVRAQLTNPKTQQEIIQQCLADLKKVSISA
ncbi:hypothetical protein BB559_005644 [Furculomyces boomerangus]|uniref:ATP synthase subunit 4 n=2 Tax=Harpellales TaxID=61421 RepID=A0A2T9Y7H6_9FUNG|nr:hypothetical protein BB559_005644 [Furculomyces boomerangus]PWA02454.1 hypothetical protein BB558_001402 [Smittium angustum]